MKLQALQFYINSKTIGLQRVKTVIISAQMVFGLEEPQESDEHIVGTAQGVYSKVNSGLIKSMKGRTMGTTWRGQSSGISDA